jgi:hypothetical protein
VGGEQVEMAVTVVSLDGGILRVTVTHEGRQRRYEFDLKAERWRELGADWPPALPNHPAPCRGTMASHGVLGLS